MSTHNIQFNDKIRKKIPKYLFSYWKDFVETEKRVRIIQGKRSIRVRTIEVILYLNRRVSVMPTCGSQYASGRSLPCFSIVFVSICVLLILRMMFH